MIKLKSYIIGSKSSINARQFLLGSLDKSDKSYILGITRKLWYHHIALLYYLLTTLTDSFLLVESTYWTLYFVILFRLNSTRCDQLNKSVGRTDTNHAFPLSGNKPWDFSLQSITLSARMEMKNWICQIWAVTGTYRLIQRVFAI